MNKTHPPLVIYRIGSQLLRHDLKKYKHLKIPEPSIQKSDFSKKSDFLPTIESKSWSSYPINLPPPHRRHFRLGVRRQLHQLRD